MDYKNSQAVDIINRRTKKAIASILGTIENEYEFGDDQWEHIRKVVMDQINELANLSIDCVRTSLDLSPNDISNDLWYEMLAEIHDVITNGDF